MQINVTINLTINLDPAEALRGSQYQTDVPEGYQTILGYLEL